LHVFLSKSAGCTPSYSITCCVDKSLWGKSWPPTIAVRHCYVTGIERRSSCFLVFTTFKDWTTPNEHENMGSTFQKPHEKSAPCHWRLLVIDCLCFFITWQSEKETLVLLLLNLRRNDRKSRIHDREWLRMSATNAVSPNRTIQTSYFRRISPVSSALHLQPAFPRQALKGPLSKICAARWKSDTNDTNDAICLPGVALNVTDHQHSTTRFAACETRRQLPVAAVRRRTVGALEKKGIPRKT